MKRLIGLIFVLLTLLPLQLLSLVPSAKATPTLCADFNGFEFVPIRFDGDSAHLQAVKDYTNELNAITDTMPCGPTFFVWDAPDHVYAWNETVYNNPNMINVHNFSIDEQGVPGCDPIPGPEGGICGFGIPLLGDAPPDWQYPIPGHPTHHIHGAVILGGSVSIELQGVTVSQAKSILAHEMMHALTGITDNYEAFPSASNVWGSNGTFNTDRWFDIALLELRYGNGPLYGSLSTPPLPVTPTPTPTPAPGDQLIRTREAVGSHGDGQYTTAANCLAEEQVIGGGYKIGYPTDAVGPWVVDSGQLSNGWSVRTQSVAGIYATVRVYAQCLTPAAGHVVIYRTVQGQHGDGLYVKQVECLSTERIGGAGVSLGTLPTGSGPWLVDLVPFGLTSYVRTNSTLGVWFNVVARASCLQRDSPHGNHSVITRISTQPHYDGYYGHEVSCLAGESPIGGGFFLKLTPAWGGPQVITNKPTATGWRVDTYSTRGIIFNVAIYAQCLQLAH